VAPVDLNGPSTGRATENSLPRNPPQINILTHPHSHSLICDCGMNRYTAKDGGRSQSPASGGILQIGYADRSQFFSSSVAIDGCLTESTRYILGLARASPGMTFAPHARVMHARRNRIPSIEFHNGY